MAKFRLKPHLTRVKGATQKYYYPGTSFRRTGLKIAKNQHSEFIGKKPATGRKSSADQKRWRTRFKDVACMWRDLTDKQYLHFQIRQQIWTDFKCNNTIRLMDCFTALGMTFSLNYFLNYNLKLALNWNLDKDGDFFKASVIYGVHGSPEKSYYLEEGWTTVPIDRSHLKGGYTRIKASGISADADPKFAEFFQRATGGYHESTLFGIESPTQVIYFTKSSFTPPLKHGKYYLTLDHENFYSDVDFVVDV